MNANPFDGTYAQNTKNRPTVRRWGSTACATPYLFTEMYSYTPGGLATKKWLIASNGSSQSFQLETSQTYDNEGKALTVKFPDSFTATGSTYNYTYDELARPVKLVEDYTVSGQIYHRTWVDTMRIAQTTSGL